MTFSIDDKDLLAEPLAQEAQGFEIASIPRPYALSWDAAQHPWMTLNDYLAQHSKNLLIIDAQVWSLYGEHIECREENIFKVTATESFKGIDGVLALYDFLHQHHVTKGETLVVVGGGITQDIAAFAAATYKRGLNWVYFPTTLLSMSDSCIGGKAGVNYKGSKNQLALFSAPRSVVIHPGFLATLAQADIQSGLGEILKLCITGGRSLMDMYSAAVQYGVIVHVDHFKHLILSALTVKRAVIEVDEFELNLRKGLNYGHTLGHVIESMSEYAIPHGIAVVVGMILVNQLSHEKGFLSAEDCLAVNALCLSLIDEHTLGLLKKLDTSLMFARLREDKKVQGDEVTFVLLFAPGKLGFVKMQMDAALERQLMGIFARLF